MTFFQLMKCLQNYVHNKQKKMAEKTEANQWSPTILNKPITILGSSVTMATFHEYLMRWWTILCSTLPPITVLQFICYYIYQPITINDISGTIQWEHRIHLQMAICYTAVVWYGKCGSRSLFSSLNIQLLLPLHLLKLKSRLGCWKKEQNILLVQ